MSDNNRGIYRKFNIERTDGSSAPGGKHEHCRYFVLDLAHDPHAIPALAAYAQACKETHPVLASDLQLMIASTFVSTSGEAPKRASASPNEVASALMELEEK